MKVETTAKSVNSKLLYNEINETLRDGVFTVNITWSNDDERNIFIDFMNNAMHEIYEQGKITQWKIQCNSNNNTSDDMMQGIFKLDVYYKQKNCLNVTRIRYNISET